MNQCIFFSSFVSVLSHPRSPHTPPFTLIKEEKKKYLLDSPIEVVMDEEDEETHRWKPAWQQQRFCDLELGDSIRVPDSMRNVVNQNIVIATFQLLWSPDVNMYNLENNLVTGSHLVYSELFEQWIPVAQHTDAILCNQEHVRRKYDEEEEDKDEDEDEQEILYCINTSTGYIQQNHCLFTDWDEMLPNDFVLMPENQPIQCVDFSFIQAKNVRLGDYIFLDSKRVMVIGIVKTSSLFYPQHDKHKQKEKQHVNYATISKEDISKTLHYHFYVQPI